MLFQVGFDLICITAENKESPLYFKSKMSGTYRSGFVVLAVEVVAGTFDIVPTTFRPGQQGPFFLKVESSSPVTLVRTK